ncbi:DASH family cryptochrome [Massilia sp. TS11]|uniref:DASH family cryptochrome n=1 Tax=Massilia sp. TS11 TaxID=2908003 RepID=UPI001EDC6597|nr:DASH family cryptochrome [Massilia sp. TS11]MCG2585053.1 DASH family cryptochrome [Massilia sp. TS11]
MSTLVYWFRRDLRLHDNPALQLAAQRASRLLPVYCHAPGVGPHRAAFERSALDGLRAALRALGSDLIELQGPAPAALLALDADAIVCEEIAAPEEQDEVAALRAAGCAVETCWQSSLLDPASLPFAVAELPKVFTAFRQQVEGCGLQPPAPLPAPVRLPPLPAPLPTSVAPHVRALHDGRAAFPYALPAWQGSEQAALAHWAHYLARGLPHTYKATRNALSGIDMSSKLSPWLALGAISARRVLAELRRFEAAHGASDSSYWLWFELLWRDYFRFLHLQHGRALYRGRGLGAAPPPAHDAAGFARWCAGETGQDLVDAGMRELAATGFLSNRMRQIVASYLIYELGGDWRQGAAWFERQLVDYDVYSNQGNWLYIAGRGTDPRGGRRFDPDKQAREYDRDGAYRRNWGRA